MKIKPLIISTIVTIILFSAIQFLFGFDMIQMFAGGLIGYAVLILYIKLSNNTEE